MSRRVRRSQDRAYRIQNAALRGKIKAKEFEVGQLRSQLQEANLEKAKLRSQAKEAFQRFIAQSEYYERAIDAIAEEMGRQLGDQLAPYAKRIWKDSAKNRSTPMVDFELTQPASDQTIEILHIFVPELRLARPLKGDAE